MVGTAVEQTCPPQSTLAAGSLIVSMVVSLVQDWSLMVELPKVRALLGVGVGVGGVYGPEDEELTQPLSPPELRARTPTMYVLALSTLMVMLVPVWLSAARLQLLPLPSEL